MYGRTPNTRRRRWWTRDATKVESFLDARFSTTPSVKCIPRPPACMRAMQLPHGLLRWSYNHTKASSPPTSSMCSAHAMLCNAVRALKSACEPAEA